MHGKDVIMSDKGHRECSINERMSTNLPSTVIVAAVLFFALVLRRLFELKYYPYISNSGLTRELLRYLNLHTIK